MNRDTISYASVVVLVLLLVCAAAPAGAGDIATQAPATLDIQGHRIAATPSTIDIPVSAVLAAYPQAVGNGTPAITGPGNQTHPALGRSPQGIHLVAYTDSVTGQIVYGFSQDDGASYDPGAFYEVGGDYPAVDLWAETTFFGTFITDADDNDGGATYLFSCTDPTNIQSYSLVSYAWSTQGWSDMKAASIACDSSQNPHEWGISSYVMSTTYETGYVDGPTIVYANPGDPSRAYISWFYGWDRCKTTDVAIDHTVMDDMVFAFMVYDQQPSGQNSQLLVRVKDVVDVEEGVDFITNFTSAGNLTAPSVAAGAGNVVILAESDLNGSKDIVCLHGTALDIQDENLSVSVLAATPFDEGLPDVQYVQDDKFQATFQRNGTLYTTITEDAGATWSTPVEVDTMVAGRGASSLAEAGIQAMYEVWNGNDTDLFVATVGTGVVDPVLKVSITPGFGLGVKATVNNLGNIAATSVVATVSIQGGVLGLIKKSSQSTIDSLDVQQERQVAAAPVFGFGPVTVKVTATCAEGPSASASMKGTQFFIFTSL